MPPASPLWPSPPSSAPALPPNVSVARTAAEFLRAHLADPITVADAADAVGYSQFHFTRLFTRALQCSPGHYLAAVRFERAKQLLLTEDFPVRDICHQVGFTSPATFTRRFANEVTVAPAALRRLADHLADTTLLPFSLPHPTGAPQITGTITVPEQLRGRLGDRPLIWIGTYDHPRPAGRPRTGTLLRGDGHFELPALGSPWLLATAIPAAADPLDQLAATTGLVAVHPTPLYGSAQVQLRLTEARHWSFPLLTALPSLYFDQLAT